MKRVRVCVELRDTEREREGSGGGKSKKYGCVFCEIRCGETDTESDTDTILGTEDTLPIKRCVQLLSMQIYKMNYIL